MLILICILHSYRHITLRLVFLFATCLTIDNNHLSSPKFQSNLALFPQGALDLCNAAAAKTRAAMDAPYNNAHSLTFARMKHNTCVMRARSLHRRILIQEETAAWEGQYKMGKLLP